MALLCIGIVAIVWSSACFEVSCSADTFGQEFVFSYLTPFNKAGIPYLMITTQSTHPTLVNISVPGTGFTETHMVTKDAILNRTLSNDVYPPTNEESKYNKSIIIRSNSDISIHGMYAFVHSGGGAQGAGFLVMPTSMLGKEYITVAYPPQQNHFSEFSVTALQRKTRVQVRVKVGHDIDIVLQPYESYQVRRRLDLTGSIIIADYPVSVMSGVSCANIPIRFPNCEHLLIHVPDVSSFGNRHIIAPFLYRTSGYIYRVIASQTATNVQINYGDSNPITSYKGPGDFYEGDITNAQRKIVVVTSDKPVMVVQYAKSRNTDNKGDPLMFVLPPVSLFHGSVNFPATTLPSKFQQASYVSVIILCDDSEVIQLDSENPEWTDTITSDTDPTYCVLRKTIGPGLHNVTSSSNDALFSVYVYGFGRFSSYGYIAAENGHVSRTLQPDDEFAGHDDQEAVTLNCGPTSMIATIDQSLVSDGLPSDVHLLDPVCFGRVSGRNLEIEARYDRCGMISEETNKGSTFRNRLIYNPPPSPILRDSELDIPLVCHVQSSAILSVGAMEPQVDKVDTIVEGVDGIRTNLTFQFRMFTDSSYEKPYLDYEYPVDVTVKQRLYFQVSVSNANNNEFMLSIRDIVASVGLDINETPNYDFIENGCRKDTTVAFHETDEKRINRFSLSAVGFSGNFTKVYVHCRVIVCNISNTDLCNQNCFPRLRRDVSERSTSGFAEHKLSQGPLIITKEHSLQDARGAVWRTFGIPITTLMVGVCIGCMVPLLVWIIYRRRQRRFAHAYSSSSIEMSEISEISKL